MATAEPGRVGSDVPPIRGDDITIAQLIDLFAHPRRRNVLIVLRREDRAMAVSELAEWIVTEEEGTPPTAVSPAQRDLVGESLLQVHLPRLDAARLVEFDSDREIVSLAATT